MSAYSEQTKDEPEHAAPPRSRVGVVVLSQFSIIAEVFKRKVKDFELPEIERYGEPFAVPEPEAVPLDGVYTKPDGTKTPGRMGLCWTIGKGRVFYFTPGHETYDDFFRPEVKLIMANAVKWAAG